MASADKRIVQIGPFAKGLNNFSDPSAIPDDALSELVNMELDLDGSLVSRPPFSDTGAKMPLGISGDMQLLGYYYSPQGAEYLLASDGVSTTYYLSAGVWNVLTDTFAATAMTQFDDKAWLLAPVGSTNPGGTWTPSGGFSAEANMPRGTIIVSFKFRLWIAQGEQATTNGSRLYFSKIHGITPFWPATPDFIDIARGDGQSIVSIKRYYESLLIFRTSSIFRFQYTSDPAQGIIEVSVPNIGLDTRHSLAEYENYFYFMYDDRAYEYMNGRAHDISQAIVFETGTKSGYVLSRAVSIFRSRVLFTFYDTLYVFSLITRTWSKWQMPSIGGISKILERRSDDFTSPSAYAMSSLSQVPKEVQNVALRGSFEQYSGDEEVLAVNLCRNPSGTREEDGAEKWLLTNVGGGLADTEHTPEGFRATFTRSATTTAMTIRVGPYDKGSRDDGIHVESGKRYVMSLDVMVSGNDARCLAIDWQDASGNHIGVSSNGGLRVSLSANTEHRLEVTGVAPSRAVRASLVLYSGTTGPAPRKWLAGNWIRIRRALVRQINSSAPEPIGPYFDGDTSRAGQTVYAWEGAPHKSASSKRTLGGEVLWVEPNAHTSPMSDPSWRNSGDRSLLIEGVTENTDTYVDQVVGGLTPGRTYTVAARQNVAFNEGVSMSPRAAQMEVLEALSTSVLVPGSTESGERTVRARFIAESLSVRIRLHGGVGVDDGTIHWDDLTVVTGEVDDLEPFSGSSEAEGNFIYFWGGEIGNSVSTRRDNGRESPLYRISEELGSEREIFECLVRTKVFNYDESSKYKRLFWWGIDAIFRQTVVGTVTPIAYGGQVTWGELLQYTWGQLLAGTWGQPTQKGLSVETIRPDLGSTAQRKFSKFNKKLRFRQVQFEVKFDTDGSSQTAPVRLFSIHSEVTQAQTVSKAIT